MDEPSREVLLLETDIMHVALQNDYIFLKALLMLNINVYVKLWNRYILVKESQHQNV